MAKDKDTMGLHMKYFVLKPAGQCPYALASRAAMRTYADFIQEKNQNLADDLYKWADAEAEKPHE